MAAKNGGSTTQVDAQVNSYILWQILNNKKAAATKAKKSKK